MRTQCVSNITTVTSSSCRSDPVPPTSFKKAKTKTMDNQQVPTVMHRELCSIFYNNLNGKRIWNTTQTHVTESPSCTPETNTRLLINYIYVLGHSVLSEPLWPHGLYPTRLISLWDSPGKNTGVGRHFLLQRIFLTQESNPGLLHCRQILYRLSYEGSPMSTILQYKIKIKDKKLQSPLVKVGLSLIAFMSLYRFLGHTPAWARTSS